MSIPQTCYCSTYTQADVDSIPHYRAFTSFLTIGACEKGYLAHLEKESCTFCSYSSHWRSNPSPLEDRCGAISRDWRWTYAISMPSLQKERWPYLIWFSLCTSLNEGSMLLAWEAKKGLSLTGTLGGSASTEASVDAEDPDSDISDKLQVVIAG